MTDHRGIDATTIVIKTQVLTTISTKTLVIKTTESYTDKLRLARGFHS